MQFKYLIILLLSVLNGVSNAQSFIESSQQFNISHSYVNAFYGGGVSLYDFDQDGLDDITLAQNTSPIHFYRNTGDGFEQLFLIPLNLGIVKAVCWFDYDNDGDLDFICTSFQGPTRLYNNDGNLVLTEVSEQAGIMPTAHKTLGLAIGDYNRDSWLDFYVCNYNYNDGITNSLFQSNGDGTFSETTLLSGTGNGAYFTFQANFTDYDHNLWPDLAVINDRVIINSHNYLYRNKEDGTFEDVSYESHFNLNINSMSICPNDFDMDGDLDYYISNTQAGNLLMRNDDGVFTDVAGPTNITVQQVSWSATFLDFDNDKDEDIMVATAPLVGAATVNYFGLNLGNGQFSQQNGIGIQTDLSMSYSGGRGDLNNDGYPDFVWNNSAPHSSRVYMNTAANNNYAGVELQGTISNSDAIGTWINCWIEGQKFVKYTSASESYLSQHSHKYIFGLAGADQIDSMILEWPSGLIEKHYNISSGAYHQFIEAQTINPSISVDGSLNICEGDSVLLSTNAINPLWNNGIQNSSFWVYESGTYFVHSEIIDGYLLQSEAVTINVNELPSFTVASTNPDCFGNDNGTILCQDIVAVDPYFLSVNGIAVQNLVLNLGEGNYSVMLRDSNNCKAIYEIILENESIIEYNLSSIDASCFDGNDGSVFIEFISAEAPVIFYINGQESELENTNLSPGEYELYWIDEVECFGSTSVSISSPEEIIINSSVTASDGDNGQIELMITGGIPPYFISLNGEESTEIISGLSPGNYSIEVTDINECSASTIANVPLYISVNELNSNIFNIYPVPFNDYLQIEQSSSIISTLQLLDLSGKLILESQIESLNIQLDTRYLASGTYILKISNVNYQGYFRVLKTEN